MGLPDYFSIGGAGQGLMRLLLEREATQRADRFGIPRRRFLGGAMGALAATSILEQAPRFRSVAEAQADFRPPTEDCYAEVEAAHATFAQSDTSTPLDWQIIQAAARAQQPAVAPSVMNMLRALNDLHIGAPISRGVHTRQMATRALRANSSDETVFISLMHDAAEVVSGTAHAEVAAALVRPYVSEASYHIVRTHMEFQLLHYGDKLLLPTNLRERYAGEPWYDDAVIFSDAFDQLAFDPHYDTLPLEEFEPLVREFFDRPPEHRSRTAEDCLPTPRKI